MIQNYSDPIVTLNQVYRALDTGTTPVLGACIIGPNYLVREYEDFGEDLRLDSNENYPVSTYSNSFDYASGLDARPFPARAKGDEKYLDAKVLVKNAKLLYQTFTASASVVIESNSQLDQLSIKVSGVPVKFKDPDPLATDDVYEAGDEVIIDLSDSGSGSGYSQICQITGIIKDATTGDYTKCVLSKNIKLASTDIVKKITFFKYKDCYVDATKVTLSESDSVPYIGIGANTISEPISLVQEEATSYPIYSGAFYAEYRALSTKHSTAYGQISSIDLVEEILGKVSAKNPLGIAVASALTEAEGSFVYFVALDSDPEDDEQLVQAYERAAALIADIDGIHGIVPCTSNKQVLKALLSFVENQSAQQVPYFKFLYGSADVQDKRQIEDMKNKGCQITTSDSITTIRFTSSALLTSSETFKAGDYIGYGDGEFAVITGCDNKNTITTSTAIDNVINKVSLYKALTNASDIVNALIADKAIADKRGSIVFADGPMYEGSIAVQNYCTAAALAGLRSVSEPHAPLSNVALKGITCAEEHGITKKLSDKLGANGFWRVGNNEDGVCISKRQLTSAAANDVNYDEQSIVTNVDSICLDLKTTGRAYVGNTNISGALLDILENLLRSKLDKYKKYTNALLGPQLLSGNLISIEQDPVYKDRIYASLEGEPPKPFNKFHITFYML